MENYVVKVISHIKIDNHIEYVINIDNKISGSNIFFPEKYSNLRHLYDLMKKESKAKKFPSFPPNKLFGYEEENFVKQRAKDLNKFFEEITNNQNYNNLPSFNNFIITNLKKNQVTPDPISTIEQKNVDIFSENKNYKNRALLFKFKFLKTEFQTQRALSQEEYDYILKEAEQKVEKLNKKFVNINYDINISPKIKLEPKYNNICNNINNNNSNENICIKGSSDDNFNYIGKKDKNSENIINIEKNMKIYLSNKMDKFSSLNNLIDKDNFFIK